MITKCVFCGKRRKGKTFVDQDWISDIYIVDARGEVIFERMSVCPSCRLTHKIAELWGATIKKNKNGTRIFGEKDLIKIMVVK